MRSRLPPSARASLCSTSVCSGLKTNAFLRRPLSSQKAASQHGLAARPGAALEPGGTGQDARHHPLCTRLQGKVPRTEKQKHLPESPSCWLPEFTHRELKDRELPGRFQDLSLSLSLGGTLSSRTRAQGSANTKSNTHTSLVSQARGQKPGAEARSLLTPVKTSDAKSGPF